MVTCNQYQALPRESALSLPVALLTDRQGLYAKLTRSANTETTQAERHLAIDTRILLQGMEDPGSTVCWVNSDHQSADGLAKPSWSAAQVDFLTRVIASGIF